MPGRAVLEELPPSLNLYKRVRIVKMKSKNIPIFYTTGKGKEYIKKIKEAYKGPFFQFEKLKVNLILKFKDKRKRDIDNYTKLTFDALEGTAYKNDNQIEELTILKETEADKNLYSITIDKI